MPQKRKGRMSQETFDDFLIYGYARVSLPVKQRTGIKHYTK